MALQCSDEMINEVTAALVTFDELQFMMTALVFDPDIVHSEIRTSIKCAIQRFGKQLQLEAGGGSKAAVGAAFQDTLVALNATDLLMRPSELTQRQRRIDVIDPDDQKSDTSHLHVREANIWHDVFARSHAYPAFKSALMDLAHNPYEQRVTSALGGSLFNERGCKMESLRKAAKEISWVPIHLISVSFQEPSYMADRLKGCVERWMGEVWNWWPLAPRLHTLPVGFCRLKWKEVCPQHMEGRITTY